MPARHVHRPASAGRRPRHHRRRAPHHRRDDGQGQLRCHPPGHRRPRQHLRAGAGWRSRGRPGADRAAVRRSRLRLPRSRVQPDPHPGAALSRQATAGLWVGGAVAAYTLPGVVGALVFGRRLRRVPARRLLLADNVVRGVFLGAVPLAWLAGLLTLPLYVVLLAVSSLLHAWGSAGRYTLLAELLPDEQRLAANTLVSSLNFAATIAGPVIAG